MIRNYVRYQEDQEKKEEAQQLNFDFSDKHDWAATYGGKPKPPSKKVDVYYKNCPENIYLLFGSQGNKRFASDII